MGRQKCNFTEQLVPSIHKSIQHIWDGERPSHKPDQDAPYLFNHYKTGCKLIEFLVKFFFFFHLTSVKGLHGRTEEELRGLRWPGLPSVS